MGTFLNILGIIFIAIGTFLMFRGSNILSRERDTILKSFLMKQFESIKIEQITETKSIVSQDSDIKLIIQNLTFHEKYDLFIFARGFENIDKKSMMRIMRKNMKSLVENFKPPYSADFNPFQETIDSLVRKDIIIYENNTVRFTHLGKEIVNNMIKNNIPPFDEI